MEHAQSGEWIGPRREESDAPGGECPGVLYRDVCIEGLGHVIPEHVVTSAWIEEQLAPVFGALGIPPGQIERLSGIRARRWWSEGVAFSDGAAMAAERALEQSGVSRGEIRCLVNGSVLRDYLEPATAAVVHHKLGLLPTAISFDVGNACLGFLSGMLVVANMIELGQIEAGLVVAAEGSRDGQLATIERLLRGPASLQDCFENFASFTIGSGAVAMVLTHRRRSRTGRRLLGGCAHAKTEHYGLCVFDGSEMRTNSTKLLHEGLETVYRAWDGFRALLGWDAGTIDHVFTHQVAEKQRQLFLAHTGIAGEKDHPTVHELGNIASVSAPLGLSLAIEQGELQPGDRICMVGVGSGINSLVLGMEW